MDRACLLDLQHMLNQLRDEADDYVIVSVGVRGPNIDCPDGNAVATVRMGADTATCEAKYLDDALSLARAHIRREREAREATRKKAANPIEAGTGQTAGLEP